MISIEAKQLLSLFLVIVKIKLRKLCYTGGSKKLVVAGLYLYAVRSENNFR